MRWIAVMSPAPATLMSLFQKLLIPLCSGSDRQGKLSLAEDKKQLKKDAHVIAKATQSWGSPPLSGARTPVIIHQCASVWPGTAHHAAARPQRALHGEKQHKQTAVFPRGEHATGQNCRAGRDPDKTDRQREEDVCIGAGKEEGD
ncbi:hypothetical protein EYF80_027571 [Liparis tanakae]|uniref:Uncharacterized protein n=1 Tax=Liparis tanakae TaxID=230148 RepID=A0A4Z2H9B0_9TELE|nr:hypothetical protein EYF80_027571 [Liparis tanakae]